MRGIIDRMGNCLLVVIIAIVIALVLTFFLGFFIAFLQGGGGTASASPPPGEPPPENTPPESTPPGDDCADVNENGVCDVKEHAQPPEAKSVKQTVEVKITASLKGVTRSATLT